MTVDAERLRRLLGGSELTALRQRLRARFRRQAPAEIFTLTSLGAAERSALEGLLGRSASSAGSMRMSQSALDQALSRAGIASDLRAALEALDGPIVDTVMDRQALAADWERLFAAVVQPRLQDLLRGPVAAQAQALVKRLGGNPAAAATLLDQAARVLDELPGKGIARSQLAAQTLGDAHALDDGAVATLVLQACAAVRGEFDDPEQRRSRNRWAEIGVLVDGLSRPALTLNLPGADGLAALAAASGEPLHLSLRYLMRSRPRWLVRNREVFVCENPTIVTLAADRLGLASAPLVCSEGMPAAAQRTLLRQLVEAGACLHYHGDFDWPGITIGNFVSRSFGARPWRFSAADYNGAMEKPLQGPSVSASWDPDLMPKMAQRGLVLHEEAVAETLLADLAAAGRRIGNGWNRSPDGF